MKDRTRIGVLFVCHANMCRSPLAEGVFAHKVAQRGLGASFDIDSAGTFATEGVEPHPHSVAVARAQGIDLLAITTACSRPLRPDDLERFSHILAMDRANLAEIERLRRISAFGAVEGPSARVRLLRTVFDPNARGSDRDVPDPIGRGTAAYLRVYEMLDTACTALLDELMGRRSGSP